MRALLVCAGFGTRLSPLTNYLPKPAVPVANRPLGWFALDHLHRAGIRDFMVNTHHLAATLRHALEPLVPSDSRVRFVHEPEILGTGGGIKNAWRSHAAEPLLTMNGKLLFAPDLAAAQRLHEDSDAIATMVLKPMPIGEAFSPVEIDADGRIRRMLAEPNAAPSGLQRTMYTGVQLLAPRAFDDLPDTGCVIRQGYLRWLARGERVMGVIDPGTFRDAGISPFHYWEANQALLRGSALWPGITPDLHQNVISTDVAIPSTTQVTQSAIGPGARISGNLTVTRCVIWPNAHVTTDLTDTIVLTDGTQVTLSA